MNLCGKRHIFKLTFRDIGKCRQLFVKICLISFCNMKIGVNITIRRSTTVPVRRSFSMQVDVPRKTGREDMGVRGKDRCTTYMRIRFGESEFV